MNNKKGWIRIIEAFVAILLIMGVLTLVIDRNYEGKEDNSQKIYEAQVTLLHQISISDEDKSYISDDDETEIQSRIDGRVPNYLTCDVEICDKREECELAETDTTTDKDIFAQDIIVGEKRLNLFCWV